MASRAAVHLHTSLAVVGADDRVVLILSGRDAVSAAEDWQERGYRVLPMTPPADLV